MSPVIGRSGGREVRTSHPHYATGPVGVPRLLAGLDPAVASVGLDQHLERWGRLPAVGSASILDELDRSGLRGHGGAWFPVGTKWRSVKRSVTKRPVIVANGAEGEPASGKDRLLLDRLPHLVLDGATVAAIGLGASRVIVHVPAARIPMMRIAIDERRRFGLDSVDMEIVEAPNLFLAGQESAAVNTINNRNPGRPSFTGITAVRECGVGGRPTLVQNVESLAHVALIARFGSAWFRRVGTHESPGTALLTVTGRWPEPRIIEAPLGLPLQQVLGLSPGDAGSFQALLLGGYGGGWVPMADAMVMPLTEEAAREHGASIGPGVVALLPSQVCSLSEVSRVVTYLESQGAGQCGPCVNGLAGLANSMEALAFQPSSLRGGASPILAHCDLIEGRGACRHPDGVTRFVRSALRVFSDHVASHLGRGPCRSQLGPFLPIPTVSRFVRQGREIR
jgi:NADH:ubiquinone oxidoreductase subunit F (NADH-binding)